MVKLPRGVRIYDNGGQTIDRYTVCFPAYRIPVPLSGQPPRMETRYPFLSMSGAPFWPQGFCQHGEYNSPIDRPTHTHLGKRIAFEQLPADCQKVVLRDLNGDEQE